MNKRPRRRVFVWVVSALLLSYSLLAVWFVRGVIHGQAPHRPEELLPRPNAFFQAEASEPTPMKATARQADANAQTSETIPPSASSTTGLHVNDDVHVVFSTGCNLFQHWQAEVLLHSHLTISQRGQITRVVSGCDSEHIKRKTAKYLTHPEGLGDEPVGFEELNRTVHPRSHLHVTPSFEGAREFPWINKPMGLAHWLHNAARPVTESVIVVIDPDMMFLDTIVQDGSRTLKGKKAPYGDDGLLCTVGCSKGRVTGKWHGQDVIGWTDKVLEGRPVAQTYGLGGAWVDKFDFKAIAGESSPSRNLSFSDASHYYAVGPPMMLHLNDWKKVAPLWVKYMRPVYERDPGDIQADMYAYSIACAHNKLDHLMLDNYMISSSGMYGEAWPFVHEQKSFSCKRPLRSMRYRPTFLHMAHRWDSQVDNFMFHKGHVPPNIFRCDLPILHEPDDDLIARHQSLAKRDVEDMFLLCNAYRQINDALAAWKARFCGGKGNMTEGIMLQKKHQRCDKKKGLVYGENCWGAFPF